MQPRWGLRLLSLSLVVIIITIIIIYSCPDEHIFISLPSNCQVDYHHVISSQCGEWLLEHHHLHTCHIVILCCSMMLPNAWWCLLSLFIIVLFPSALSSVWCWWAVGHVSPSSGSLKGSSRERERMSRTRGVLWQLCLWLKRCIVTPFAGPLSNGPVNALFSGQR